MGGGGILKKLTKISLLIGCSHNLYLISLFCIFRTNQAADTLLSLLSLLLLSWQHCDKVASVNWKYSSDTSRYWVDLQYFSFKPTFAVNLYLRNSRSRPCQYVYINQSIGMSELRVGGSGFLEPRNSGREFTPVCLQVFTMEEQSQVESHDCSSSPCLDGATCEDHDGTFTCFCTENR